MIKGEGEFLPILKSFFTGIDTPTRKILVRIERMKRAMSEVDRETMAVKGAG